MTHRLLSVLCCLAMFTVSGTVAIQAQTAASASITGVVTDPQGAVVPDATLTARNADTGLERTTKSTGGGDHRSMLVDRLKQCDAPLRQRDSTVLALDPHFDPRPHEASSLAPLTATIGRCVAI